MNERIQELYKQAEKSVVFLSNSKESKEKIMREKFAELIVNECLLIADKHNAYSVMDSIIDRFGVKL